MIGKWLSPRDRVLRSIHRAQRLEAAGRRWGTWAGIFIRYRLARTWGVYVHSNATVGEVWFAHPTSVVIGAGVVIEDGVTIYQNVTLGAETQNGSYPVVRTRSTLFAGATVIGGVTIGPDAIVGAHSVVLGDVAPGTTVVGAPARAIGT